MMTTSHFPALVPTVFILARFSHPTGSLASLSLIDSPAAKPNNLFDFTIFLEFFIQLTFSFVHKPVFFLNLGRKRLT